MAIYQTLTSLQGGPTPGDPLEFEPGFFPGMLAPVTSKADFLGNLGRFAQATQMDPCLREPTMRLADDYFDFDPRSAAEIVQLELPVTLGTLAIVQHHLPELEVSEARVVSADALHDIGKSAEEFRELTRISNAGQQWPTEARQAYKGHAGKSRDMAIEAGVPQPVPDELGEHHGDQLYDPYGSGVELDANARVERDALHVADFSIAMAFRNNSWNREWDLRQRLSEIERAHRHVFGHEVYQGKGPAIVPDTMDYVASFVTGRFPSREVSSMAARHVIQIAGKAA